MWKSMGRPTLGCPILKCRQQWRNGGAKFLHEREEGEGVCLFFGHRYLMVKGVGHGEYIGTWVRKLVSHVWLSPSPNRTLDS